MKKSCWILIFLSCIIILHAQEKIKIKETRIGINTIQGSTVSLSLVFDLRDGYTHRTSSFRSNNPDLKFFIRSLTQKEITSDIDTQNIMIYGNTFLGFRFEAGERLMNKILKGDADYFIEINDTVIIELYTENKEDTVRFILTPEQVMEHTRNKLILSQEEMDELILSAGGEYSMIDNNIDFGFVPAGESSSEKTEYYMSFNYRKGYRFMQNAPVYLETSGLLSTDALDSLNHIRIFPVSYNLFRNLTEFKCQAGMESNQTFSSIRISGNLQWQRIIPNLVDLTYGANRLRLKPVIGAGLKVYGEVGEIRTDKTTHGFPALAYAHGYYYIPVLKTYSLILEGNVFYDLLREGEVSGFYSLTVGVEIPGTDIKTIFRYSGGENEITHSENKMVMIGLMADLFK